MSMFPDIRMGRIAIGRSSRSPNEPPTMKAISILPIFCALSVFLSAGTLSAGELESIFDGKTLKG